MDKILNIHDRGAIFISKLSLHTFRNGGKLKGEIAEVDQLPEAGLPGHRRTFDGLSPTELWAERWHGYAI